MAFRPRQCYRLLIASFKSEGFGKGNTLPFLQFKFADTDIEVYRIGDQENDTRFAPDCADDKWQDQQCGR